MIDIEQIKLVAISFFLLIVVNFAIGGAVMVGSIFFMLIIIGLIYTNQIDSYWLIFPTILICIDLVHLYLKHIEKSEISTEVKP